MQDFTYNYINLHRNNSGYLPCSIRLVEPVKSCRLPVYMSTQRNSSKYFLFLLLFLFIHTDEKKSNSTSFAIHNTTSAINQNASTPTQNATAPAMSNVSQPLQNATLLNTHNATLANTQNATASSKAHNASALNAILPSNQNTSSSSSPSPSVSNETASSHHNLSENFQDAITRSNSNNSAVVNSTNELANTTLQRSHLNEEKTNKRDKSAKKPGLYHSSFHLPVHNDTLESQYKYRRKDFIESPSKQTLFLKNKTVPASNSNILLKKKSIAEHLSPLNADQTVKKNSNSISTKSTVIKEKATRKDVLPLGIEHPIMDERPASMSENPVERKEFELIDSIYEDSMRDQKPDLETFDEFLQMSHDQTPIDEMSPAQLQRETERRAHEAASTTEKADRRVLKQYGLPVANLKDIPDSNTGGHVLYKRKEIIKHFSTEHKKLHSQSQLSKRHRAEPPITTASLEINSGKNKNTIVVEKDVNNVVSNTVAAKKSLPSKITTKPSTQETIGGKRQFGTATVNPSASETTNHKNKERMEHEADKQYLLKVIKLKEKTSYGRSLKDKHSIPEFAKDNVILDYAHQYRGIGQVVADFSKGPDNARLLVYSFDRNKDKKSINKRSLVERSINFTLGKFTEENPEKRMIGNVRILILIAICHHLNL